MLGAMKPGWRVAAGKVLEEAEKRFVQGLFPLVFLSVTVVCVSMVSGVWWEQRPS